MNYSDWDEYHGKVKSKKGGWVVGEGIKSHGYDLMNDLVGKCSFMQLVILNATGRMPSKELAYWIESVHLCLSWPDPRIWCNRVGALAGTNGCTAVAASFSGVLSADSKSYGIYPLIEGVDFIKNAQLCFEQGLSIEECISNNSKSIKGKPVIMGYARPIAKGDERIAAMERITNDCGFGIGKHLSLAYDIENNLSKNYDETMNINGFVSAFLADQEFTSIEAYRIFSGLVFSGVTACYVDSNDRKRGVFSPLRVDDIEYKGKAYRTLGV